MEVIDELSELHLNVQLVVWFLFVIHPVLLGFPAALELVLDHRFVVPDRLGAEESDARRETRDGEDGEFADGERL